MELELVATFVPERLRSLFTLASEKGFKVRQNLDDTISLVNARGKAFGRWNHTCGAVQFLKRY